MPLTGTVVTESASTGEQSIIRIYKEGEKRWKLGQIKYDRRVEIHSMARSSHSKGRSYDENSG